MLKMALDSETARTLITAGAALGGVVIGSSLNAIYTSIAHWRKQAREKEFLAISVIPHLDRIAYQCRLIARDDGTIEGRPSSGNVLHEATVGLPKFEPQSLNVDWKSIAAELAFKVLQLPYLLDMLQVDVEAHYSNDDYPKFGGYFFARQKSYIDFGLEVTALAKSLRESAGLPMDRHATQTEDTLKELKKERHAQEIAHKVRLAQGRAQV